ncbi:hypothetical protein [Hyphococcus sp.]|uniref:hypothetical protein n=1 Tax=Hyphococcus sp. TaxID=2038636 RepID=UPI003CCB904A
MLQSVINPVLGRRRGLKAALSGVNGYTGAGEIFYAVSLLGAESIAIRLRGIAGRKAEIFSDEKVIVTVPVENGRAGKRFTVKGGALPDFEAGANVEVRQNGHVILSGVFSRG